MRVEFGLAEHPKALNLGHAQQQNAAAAALDAILPNLQPVSVTPPARALLPLLYVRQSHGAPTYNPYPNPTQTIIIPCNIAVVDQAIFNILI